MNVQESPPRDRYARPWNETPEDRARQDAAKARIERAFRCHCVDLQPLLYGFDWSLHRGEKLVGAKLEAYGEYKCRKDFRQTIILSHAKFEHGNRLAHSAGVPALLFVEFPGGQIFWIDLTAIRSPIITATGNRRGQPGDLEPCVAIPLASMSKVRA